jgi:hypothetical protein
MSTCTSCNTALYLFNRTCLDSCPADTLPKEEQSDGKVVKICVEVNAPVLYFPAAICGVVIVMLGFIGNKLIDFGFTSEMRNRIHLLTYSSAVGPYVELFAILIVLIFTMTASSKALIIAGLVLWVVCNLIFAGYYFTVIRGDEVADGTLDNMSQQSKCIYWSTLVCSVVVSLRTYRILYCGLFMGVAPFTLPKKPQYRTNQLDFSVVDGRVNN